MKTGLVKCLFKEQLRLQVLFHFSLWTNEEDKAGFLDSGNIDILGQRIVVGVLSCAL